MSTLIIKSGTTSIEGAIVKGSFSYFSGSTKDLGPTSTTGFYSGIDAPSGGYTVYQIGGPNGWTARVATDDSSLNSILIGAGATGSTVNENISWATNTTSVYINSGPPPPSVYYYVGGYFTTYKGSSQNRFIKLDNSGTKDSSLDVGTGFNNGVEVIVTDSSGKIYAGSTAYTTYKSSSQNRLIRLLTNGTKDSTYNIGTGFGGNFTGVSDIAIDSNGEGIMVGSFTTFTGSSQNRIIRLNSDGSKDTAFDVGSGFNGAAYCVGIDSNGKIYVGGDFTTYKGVTQNRLIRLNSDGSKDTDFNIGTGFNGGVTSIAIASNNQIYCAGGWDTYKGLSRPGMIKINTDGSIDFTWSGEYPPGVPEQIILDSNQQVVMVGRYSPGIRRYNSNGSTDNTFNPGTGANGDFVYSLVQDNNGKYLVGGQFTSWNSTTGINKIVRLQSNGTLDTTFSGGTGFNSDVLSIKAITI